MSSKTPQEPHEQEREHEKIRESAGEVEPCPYLPGLQAMMRYRVIQGCVGTTYEEMLRRGWRRFGEVFFRPACASCQECRSLRIEVETFRPSRSMRRTWRRNRDLRVICRSPTLTDAHLELYERYHADMETRRDWPGKEVSPLDYYLSFVRGHGEFGAELLFLDGDRLLAVSLMDVLPSALSAVYCFYDPESRHRGLGVFSVLRQVELARQRGLPHVYLGYWVQGNASMSYKARYRPHQILQGRPGLASEPVWRPPKLL